MKAQKNDLYFVIFLSRFVVPFLDRICLRFQGSPFFSIILLKF